MKPIQLPLAIIAMSFLLISLNAVNAQGIRLIATFPGEGHLPNVVIDEVTRERAFYVDFEAGLGIIDIRNSNSPALERILNIERTPMPGISAQGDYIYLGVVSALARINIINDDITYHEGPQTVIDIQKVGTYLFCADYYSYVRKIRWTIVPGEVAQYERRRNNEHIQSLCVVGDYVYVAVGSSGLTVLRASDLEFIGRVPTDAGVATWVRSNNDYLFVACGEAGLWILDIRREPSNPTSVGFFPTIDRADGCCVTSQHCFVADLDGGLRVFDISIPQRAREVDGILTPGVAINVVALENGIVFVADQTALRVYDCREAMFAPRNPENTQITSSNVITAFPNPFNSSTLLRYSLPAAGLVSLAVYDLSGRKVVDLVDGMDSAGRHEAVWNAEGLPSGVYVARLTSPVGAATSKTLLLR